MVRLDKIYTKGGDGGLTSLGDGKRVKKSSLRVRCYGDIDESNSVIGIAMFHCSEKLKKSLSIIQNDLFDIGADLCVPGDVKGALRLKKNRVEFLENEIDDINKGLGTLKSFILPGGSLASSYLHLARCIVRRSERKISNLMDSESINEEILKYVNRLSDYLFVSARFENKKIGDVLWKPGKFQDRS